jgi:hypothetical protein
MPYPIDRQRQSFVYSLSVLAKDGKRPPQKDDPLLPTLTASAYFQLYEDSVLVDLVAKFEQPTRIGQQRFWIHVPLPPESTIYGIRYGKQNSPDGFEVTVDRELSSFEPNSRTVVGKSPSGENIEVWRILADDGSPVSVFLSAPYRLQDNHSSVSVSLHSSADTIAPPLQAGSRQVNLRFEPTYTSPLEHESEISSELHLSWRGNYRTDATGFQPGPSRLQVEEDYSSAIWDRRAHSRVANLGYSVTGVLTNDRARVVALLVNEGLLLLFGALIGVFLGQAYSRYVKRPVRSN